MLMFIFGAMAGSSICWVMFYFKQKKFLARQHNQATIELEKRLTDTKNSLRLMLEMMVASSENTRNSIKKAITAQIDSTTQFAEEGAQTLAQIAKSMELSQHFFDETTDHIHTLVVNAKQGETVGSTLEGLNTEFKLSSDKLSEIETEIEDIFNKASQITSLGQDAEMLALNAAIEAARAGDAGRGFAVVADNMKSLARSSQAISQEVQTTVSASKKSISQIAQAIGMKSNQLISTSDQLISAFSQLNDGINNTNKSIDKLEHEFGAMRKTVVEKVEAINTELEDMIRTVTINANEYSGLKIVDLSPRDAHEKLSTFDYLIDVRRPEEFNDELGHIEGAELMTLQTDFPEKIKTLPKNKRYLFICRSGGRSTKAAQQALFNDIPDVYNLKGGMIAWRKAQL